MWKVVFRTLSLVLLLLLFLIQPTSGLDYYGLDNGTTSTTSMVLTDIETTISPIVTLFTNAPTSISVTGLSWIHLPATSSNNDTSNSSNVLIWTTTIDGIEQDTGKIKLRRQQVLPTSIDIGTFNVSTHGKHTVIVTLSVDTTSVVITEHYTSYPSWVSIIPLLLIIVLALLTHMVELSLYSGLFVGACIITGSIVDGFKTSLADYIVNALANQSHVFVLLFTLLLSGLVGLIQKSGGMNGFGQFVGNYIKSSRAGQLVVVVSGLVLFFDDYTNCLLVGESLQPFTDLVMISREKLAFLVDATAAPVTSLSPVSSWIGYEINLLQNEIDRILQLNTGTTIVTIETTGFGVLLQTIQYRYYPIFLLFLLFCTVVLQNDYGPMLIAERKVRIYERTDGGDGKGRNNDIDNNRKVNQPNPGTPVYAYNMMIPVALLVGLIFYLLINTGVIPGEEQTVIDKIENGNSFTALLWGTGGATVCTMVFYLLQWFNKDGKLTFPNIRYFCKLLCAKGYPSVPKTESSSDENDSNNTGNFNNNNVYEMENLNENNNDNDPTITMPKPLLSLPEIMDSFLYGMTRIFPALIVLTLAWGVGRVMVDIGADRFFARWIVGTIQPNLLPTLSFLISFLMALATGTSWGTMSILFPLVLVPTYLATDGDAAIFYATTAGILSGSVAGDHISPISDTTVLSALSSDCQLIQHVRTQTPYVIVVVIICVMVGTVPIGYNVWPNLVGIFLGFLLCFLFAYFICVPVTSPTGRYDFVTELLLKLRKDQQLLALKESTRTYFETTNKKLFDDSSDSDKEDDDIKSIVPNDTDETEQMKVADEEIGKE